MKKIITLMGLLLVCLPTLTYSQTPILERRISVQIVNQSLGKALTIISETGKFNFSYSAQVVKTNRIVSVQAENRTVKEILDNLFNNSVTYQQIGNHLILQKKIPAKTSNKIDAGSEKKITRYDVVVNGYVRDVLNGDPIYTVSLYNKNTLANTLSGDFGYYKIAMVSNTPEFELKVTHPDYRDTVVKLSYVDGGVIDCNINLMPLNPKQGGLIVIEDEDGEPVMVDTNKLQIETDTVRGNRLAWVDSIKQKIKVEETKLGQWFVGTYQKVSNRNIRDSFSRDWQFTFIPPLSTNGALSGLVENKFSFNTLVGYNGGVNGVEFGGLANIVRRDVTGAQFSGLANIVGGKTEGAQFAGLFNHNIGTVEGFQAAGLYNLNLSEIRAVQAAGLLNINASSFDGVQMAGLANLAAGYGRGMQMAGLLNVANELDGGQISGLLNVARKIRGFQIGIVNVADTCEGIAIGIVNFIKNGMHQLELSKNDLDQYGLAYRSGSGRFYSVVSFNSRYPYVDSGTLMSYGFSIGWRAKLNKTFYLTTDIGSQHLTYNLASDHLNLLNRFNVGMEIKLFKGFAIFGNGSLNHMINQVSDPRYDTGFSKLGNQNQIWSYGGNYAQKAWLGYQFGVRLF